MVEKLSRETLRRVRAVEEALAHYSLDGDNLQAALEALRVLLETDKVLLYVLVQRAAGDDLLIARRDGVGHSHLVWLKTFEQLLGRGAASTGSGAPRLDARQRDRVLRGEELAEVTGGQSRELEALTHPQLGTAGEDCMRVLVCDGPSVLAWLGLLQPEPTTERQRELLERVVPAFRRRLEFERLVSEATIAQSALDAVLEHVRGAVWVLGPTGQLTHANAAGRARMDENATGTRAALEAAVGGTAAPGVETIPLRGTDGGVGHVIVATPPRDGELHALPAAALRLGLTPAQTRVFECVARGMSNATIATELGVAERTVEAHVTAILEKARVASRAALIVQIFRPQMTS